MAAEGKHGQGDGGFHTGAVERMRHGWVVPGVRGAATEGAVWALASALLQLWLRERKEER